MSLVDLHQPQTSQALTIVALPLLSLSAYPSELAIEGSMGISRDVRSAKLSVCVSKTS